MIAGISEFGQGLEERGPDRLQIQVEQADMSFPLAEAHWRRKLDIQPQLIGREHVARRIDIYDPRRWREFFLRTIERCFNRRSTGDAKHGAVSHTRSQRETRTKSKRILL